MNSDYDTQNQFNIAVCRSLVNDEIMMIFQSVGQNGGNHGVYGYRYSSTMVKYLTMLEVHDADAAHHRRPTISGL